MLLSINKSIELQPRVQRLLYILLSFFIPFIVLTIALIGMHIVPFGDKHSLAITDAKFYLNGEMFFARLLRGEENWLYSFNNGLGNNEWSQIAWGGVSFGGFLSLIAKLETLPFVFTWIIVINISICGLAMYMLLSYLYGHKLSHLIFSTSYALIGFNVVNCYQVLFFMGPQMLPLMVLGLVKLLRRESPLIYILSLGCCILLNFYFGFHLCVLSVLLFLAYLHIHVGELEGNVRRLFGRWAVSSLLAGLLGSVVWLPTLKAYSGGGRLNQTGLREYSFSENMPFIQIFSKLFSGANSTNELVSGFPNIFCGILIVALVILFFTDKKITLLHKRAAALLLTVYLLSFYIPAFTLLMHGGTHTNWFPYRYSYVFSFLLIMLAVDEFEHLDDISFASTKRCGSLLLLGVLIVFSTRYEFVTGGGVLLDLALLLLMWFGFYLYKTKPEKTPKSTLSLFLLLVVCGNLYANFMISTQRVQEWELNLEEYNKNIMVSGVLVEAINNSEQGFFRMEKENSESSSVGADSYLYNYNGVSQSGPAIRAFVHKGLCKLGINWFDMRHWYSEGIPAATDTLLGLKYLLSERDLSKEKDYEKLISMWETGIYKNSSALSPAILSASSVQELELGENVFDNLNRIWRAMTDGETDVFVMQENVTYTLFNDYSNQTVTSQELKESVSAATEKDEVDEDKDLEPSTYILYSFTAAQDGPVYVYDTSIPDSPNGLAAPAIRYVGFYHAGDAVEGKFPIENNIGSGDFMRGYCANMVFAYADNNQLEKYAVILSSRDITFNVLHENELFGTFTAEEGQRILFTIPWDEGWSCFIDGKKVPIDKTWDLFMSVEVPEGEHTYEMKFFPAWMSYGIVLSILAILGLIVLMIFDNKKTIIKGKKIRIDCKSRLITKVGLESVSKTRPDAETESKTERKYESGTIKEIPINNSIPEERIFSSKEPETVVIRNMSNPSNHKEFNCLMSEVFILCILFCVAIWFILLVHNPDGLQRAVFFQDENDWFMDFYNTVYFAVGRTPYSWGWLPVRSYLPIGYILVYPFSFLYKYDVSNWGTAYASRYSQLSAIAGVVFILFSVIFAFSVLYSMMKKRTVIRMGILFAMLSSSVMLFNYDRANEIILTAGLVFVYYYLLDSNSVYLRNIGLFCLSLASALKIFPAIFGVLLLHRKRYKDALLCGCYGIFLAIVPFFWLKGDFFENVWAYMAALKAHAVVFSEGNIGLGAPLLFLGGTSIPQSILCAITVIAALLSVNIGREWKKILLISLSFMLCSGQQGFYCLIILFLPIVLFLNDEIHVITDWGYLAGFVAILIPLQFSLFEGMINNIRMTNTICVSMFIVLFFQAAYIGIRKRNNNRNLSIGDS